jgi:hypothetical protein
MTDTDKLERLAREATPGPWKADMARNGHWDVVIPDEHDNDRDWLATLRGPNRDALAHYIAAASPDVILALLEERRALRAAAKRYVNHVQETGCDHENAGAGTHTSCPPALALIAALQAEPAQEGAPR